MAKTYKGETGNLYRVVYSWISYPTSFPPQEPVELFCAWCNEPRSKIKNPNHHIEDHSNYDYLYNYYKGIEPDQAGKS